MAIDKWDIQDMRREFGVGNNSDDWDEEEFDDYDWDYAEEEEDDFFSEEDEILDELEEEEELLILHEKLNRYKEDDWGGW
jgi:hypothetical protein